MSFPMTMSGHTRTYLPPRSLRAEVGGPFTAWELLQIDGPGKEWATATIDGIVASIESDAANALGCIECGDTGFYGIPDPADEDLLTGLVRSSGAELFEALTASGTWEPYVNDGALEVLSQDLATDLAEAIVAGACGLLRRYCTPMAWINPCAVVAAAPLAELLGAFVSPSPQETPDGEWVNFAVVDEFDQGAVLDLVRITAAGTGAERWIGSAWTPDEDLLVKADLPMVRLDDVQLAEIQAQVHSPMVAAVEDHLPDRQKCEYCSAQATKRILHSEGMAYIAVCDQHLAKGKDAAAHCTPDGTANPANIDWIHTMDGRVAAGLVADAPLTVSPDPRAEKLRRYWSTGRGALKIRWGLPGDWRRCYRHLRKYMGLRAKGYCQNLHKRNNSFWTGDRRNRGLLSSLSPEESLMASIQAQRWVRETGRITNMPEPVAIADGIYTEADPANGGIMNTLLAGGFPVKPPKKWFEKPELNGPTPLDVTDEGRVYGHIAPWGVSHIGMAGSIMTPKNPDGKYAYFRTGALRTEEGEDVHVGQLTLVGGHAPISATAAQAVKHYDDTNSAVADVVVGEDQYGVWAAGALRPNVTPEQIRAMRACPPSGDWRPVNGRLELVAACHVNVQGFPIAKALYASGAVQALVAAGARQMYELKAAQVGEPVLAEKVAALQVLVASLQASAATATLEQIEEPVADAPPAEPEPSAVTDTVDDTPGEIITAEIVDDTSEVDMTEEELARADRISKARDMIADIKREQLRARVRGSGAVTAALPAKFLANKKSADGEKKPKGTQSLPDGSFPISDVASLKDAIQAFGRSKNPDAAKAHIKSMARRLKRPDLIPSNWK